jgi:hypothetical protein
MNRHLLRIIFALGFTLYSPMLLQARPDDPPLSSTFVVTFDGLIVHDLYKDHPKRALIVQGGAVTMRHAPTLVVPADIDVAALRDATAQPVFCNKTECRVQISRFDMQIGTSDLERQPIEVSIDRSFSDVTPHLACVTRRGLLATVLSDLPESPIAGRFGLHDGTLHACRFVALGHFSPDYDIESDRFFADRVTLVGNMPTDAVAVLQIRSVATDGEWRVIKRFRSDNPLAVTIRNHAANHKPSTRHFALNRKLLDEPLPPVSFPVVCPAIVEPGDDVDKLCLRSAIPTASKKLANDCPAPGVACICGITCTTPLPTLKAALATFQVQVEGFKTAGKKLPPSFELLPGCANSTWP